MSISFVCMRTYIQTKVHYVTTNDVKATEFYGNVLKPCNVMAIKRMRIQCVPGTLFPSLLRLGTRLILTSMEADDQVDSVDSIEDYTTTWTNLIDRGGLDHIKDEVT